MKYFAINEHLATVGITTKTISCFIGYKYLPEYMNAMKMTRKGVDFAKNKSSNKFASFV